MASGTPGASFDASYAQSESASAPGVSSQIHELPNKRSRSLEFERGLISCCLAAPETVDVVQHIVNWKDFGCKEEKAIAQAIWACRESLPPKTATRLNVIGELQRLNTWETIVDPTFFQHLDDQGTPDIVKGASDYAERIARLSRARQFYKACRDAMSDLTASPDDIDAIGDQFLGRATPILLGASVSARDGSAKAIRKNRPLDNIRIATSLAWFDNATGGLRPKRALGIAAKSGGRKTSSALGAILGPILEGAAVDYYSLVDNTREEVYQQLIAMRATSLLRHWHESGARTDCGPATWILSPDTLQTMQRTQAQHDAISMAENEFDSYNFRAYDSDDGIVDLKYATRLARSNAKRNNTQIIVVDFMQAHQIAGMTDDTEYAIMRQAVRSWRSVIRDEDIAGVFVSQLNDKEDMRGGKDLREACYNVLFLGYTHEHPDAITWALDKNRFGTLDEITYALNPPSGLIMNPLKLGGAV